MGITVFNEYDKLQWDILFIMPFPQEDALNDLKSGNCMQFVGTDVGCVIWDDSKAINIVEDVPFGLGSVIKDNDIALALGFSPRVLCLNYALLKDMLSKKTEIERIKSDTPWFELVKRFWGLGYKMARFKIENGQLYMMAYQK